MCLWSGAWGPRCCSDARDPGWDRQGEQGGGQQCAADTEVDGHPKGLQVNLKNIVDHIFLAIHRISTDDVSNQQSTAFYLDCRFQPSWRRAWPHDESEKAGCHEEIWRWFILFPGWIYLADIRTLIAILIWHLQYPSYHQNLSSHLIYYIK